MGKAAAAVGSFFGLQQGGSVSNNPGPPYPWTPEPDARRRNFQSGGYMSQQRANYLQGERDKEYESQLMKQDLERGVDINKYEKSIEDWQKQAESGPMSWGRAAIDFITPEALMSPYLSWKTGTDVRNLSDLPRARADQMKADYRGSHLMDYPLPGEGVNLSPEAYAMHRKFSGIPEPSTVENLSDEALKKKAQSAMGNFDINEWLTSQYGENWWSSFQGN